VTNLRDGITMTTGRVFDFSNPSACEVTIEDVVVPLAHVCRYAGQVPLGRWYSVAQHAVNASRIVPPDHAWDDLMHDTAEAFTNDIVTPLKVQVPLFKDIEVAIESAMAQRFGFTYPLAPPVVLADAQMLALEMKYIRGFDPEHYDHLHGVPYEHLLPLVDLQSWAPEVAHARFMERYEELRPGDRT
jgi:hypothetical protein